MTVSFRVSQRVVKVFPMFWKNLLPPSSGQLNAVKVDAEVSSRKVFVSYVPSVPSI